MKKESSVVNLPNRTITRLSLYYQFLSQLLNTKRFISSKELSQYLGFTSSTIRKDLAFFGQFGISGKGYEIIKLHKKLEKILGIEKEWNVIVVGCGNLGSALLKYPRLKKLRFNIIAGFDISKDIVGKKINGIKIYHLNSLKNFVKKYKVDIAVISVPQEAAKSTIDYVVSCGIKGILNFTPTTVNIPGNKCKILKIDLTIEFLKLACLLSNKRYDNTKK